MSTDHRTYLQLLALPGAVALVGWTSVARLMYGVLPLSMLLLLVERRHSYAEAGAALAAYGITAGLLGPLRARLADRLESRWALGAMGFALVIALLGVTLAAEAPMEILVPLLLVAGSTPPPVGPLMRASWRRLTRGEELLIARAYSFDVVTEDLIFLIGPLLAAPGVAWLGAAPMVLGSSLTLMIAATLAGSLMPRTPIPIPGRRHGGSHRPRGWPSRSLLLGLAPMVALGLLLGSLGIAAVAVLLVATGTAMTGVPDAVLAVGSVTGGLVFGRRRWPGSRSQQAVALVGTAAVLVLLAALLTGDLTLMLMVLAGAGLCVSPAIVCSYLVADRAAPGTTMEASSWVNSAFNVSLAAGTAGAGMAIQVWSAGTAMAAAAIAAAVVLGLGAIGQRLFPRPAAGRQPVA
jgi:predicted MFS family arabinose efflux permease